MLSTLIQKELRTIITGPKFVAAFAACSLLILMSIYVGIVEYHQSQAQHQMTEQMNEEQMQQFSTWRTVYTSVYRAPDPMRIFSSGIDYDIGRWSPVDHDESVKLKNSAYSDDPIFAIFRILDFTMIVQIVLSLFALVFTFDAVNGEKENGTLRLVFSNAVPRTTYLVSKVIGSLLGLIVPLLVPILLAMLLVVAFGVHLESSQWFRLAGLIAMSLIYVSLFVVVGVLMSTVTRRSSLSFLLSLVVWIAFVLIIPRVGIMAAGHLSPVPRLAQVEGLRNGYAQEQWEAYYAGAEERFQATVNDDDSDAVAEVDMWATMELEDSLRNDIEAKIDAYEERLMEDLDNRRHRQQAVGFALARFSPAAAYQLAAMSLAGTNIGLKSNYQDAIADYRRDFLAYVDKKTAEAGPGEGAVMISMDSENGMSINSPRSNSGVDAADRPRFVAPVYDYRSTIRSVMLDSGLLVLFMLVAFSAAYVSFLRFDVR